MLLALIAIVYTALLWFLLRHGARREAAAFVIAPLAPAIAVALYDLSFVPLVMVTPFSFLFTLPAIPFFFLYRRLGWTSIWSVVALSTLLGALAGLPMNAISFEDGFRVTNEHNLLAMMAYGALVGAVFWFVAYSPSPRKASVSTSSERRQQ